MSIQKLLSGVPGVVNIGLSGFAADLAAQNIPVVQVDWRPPAQGKPHLAELLARLGEHEPRIDKANQEALQRGLGAIRAPPDRVDRLKSLLARESSMLELVGTVSNDMAEIERRRREETLEEGY